MQHDESAIHDFHARTYPLKIYAGADALVELPRELQRAGAARALILCGRSVRERTGLTQMIETLADGRVAGAFSGISEGAPVDAGRRLTSESW